MIQSRSDYRAAVCRMIRTVQTAKSADEINSLKMTAEDAEILNDCIESGFIRGRISYLNSDGKEIKLRTLDGKAHPQVFSTVITMKGLEFLKPDRTKLKANLALVFSALAVVVSVCSVLVTGMANLDKILGNLSLLMELFR